MIVDLVVDGARFTVTERPGRRGVHDFVWQSGPNPGYGFTMAAHGAGPVGKAGLRAGGARLPFAGGSCHRIPRGPGRDFDKLAVRFEATVLVAAIGEWL
jgi:hypothetical protein